MIVRHTHCILCGTPMTNRYSQKIGIGPECRQDMTEQEIEAAIERNNPLIERVPADEPASARAQWVNATARAVMAEAAAPPVCQRHASVRCSLCARSQEAATCAWPIIEDIIAERRRAASAAPVPVPVAAPVPPSAAEAVQAARQALEEIRRARRGGRARAR